MEVFSGGGYSINRKGKDYISIADRKGQKLRLRGPIYSETFTSPESLAVPEKGFGGESKEEREKRITERREAYERESEKRRQYIESRFQYKYRKYRVFDINTSSENESLALLDDVDSGDNVFRDDDNHREIHSIPTVGNRNSGDVVLGRAPLHHDHFPKLDDLPTFKERANLPLQSEGVKDDRDREYVVGRIGQAFERIHLARQRVREKIGEIGNGIRWLRDTILWLEQASDYFTAANERLGRSLRERSLRKKEKIELSMRVQKSTLDHGNSKPRVIKENYKNKPGL